MPTRLGILMIEHLNRHTSHFFVVIQFHIVWKNNKLLLAHLQKLNIELLLMQHLKLSGCVLSSKNLPFQLLLFCDNLGETHLSFNRIQYSRMKQFHINIHFVHEFVEKETLNVRHAHTQDHGRFIDKVTIPVMHWTLTKLDWHCL